MNSLDMTSGLFNAAKTFLAGRARLIAGAGDTMDDQQMRKLAEAAKQIEAVRSSTSPTPKPKPATIAEAGQRLEAFKAGAEDAARYTEVRLAEAGGNPYRAVARRTVELAKGGMDGFAAYAEAQREFGVDQRPPDRLAEAQAERNYLLGHAAELAERMKALAKANPTWTADQVSRAAVAEELKSR